MTTSLILRNLVPVAIGGCVLAVGFGFRGRQRDDGDTRNLDNAAFHEHASIISLFLVFWMLVPLLSGFSRHLLGGEGGLAAVAPVGGLLVSLGLIVGVLVIHRKYGKGAIEHVSGSVRAFINRFLCGILGAVCMIGARSTFLGLFVAVPYLMGDRALAAVGLSELEEAVRLQHLTDISPLHLVSVCIVGPIGEELLHRGVILPILVKRWGWKAAILMSAVVFALGHALIPLVALTLVDGIMLGIVFYRTRSVTSCIVAHIALNTFVVIAKNWL